MDNADAPLFVKSYYRSFLSLVKRFSLGRILILIYAKAEPVSILLLFL